MEEVDVIKIDKKGICVAIKTMTLNEWMSLKKQKGYVYRAFQKGFHSFEVGR